MAQQGVTEEERDEKDKRVWSDPNEGLKFVNEKGKVQCQFCSKQEGKLKVTSNDISLQDVPYMTNADKDGKVNFIFQGGCSEKKNAPCVSVINLDSWKDYADVHINNDYALIVNSTIKCLTGGTDITITHSGQIAEIVEVEPKKNLRIQVITKPARVCEPMICQAIYKEAGEEVLNEDIQWKVKVFSGKKVKDEEGNDVDEFKLYNLEEVKLEKTTLGALDGKPLSEAKDADSAGTFKLKGNEIRFNVPKEWGQKQVQFIANFEDKTAQTVAKIKVLDHIVAAFYRIDSKTPEAKIISNVNKIKGTNNVPLVPVHHHQGMYRVTNTFYISGSTSINHPSYANLIDDNGNNTYQQNSTIQFTGGILDEYRHAGGMQVANGLMAIGIEAYNYGLKGLFGSAVHQRSVLCFFDGGKEMKKLRIIKDGEYVENIAKLKGTLLAEDKLCLDNNVNRSLIFNKKNKELINDYASAVGIIFCKKKLWIKDPAKEIKVETPSNVYYVISRGQTQGITLYEINESKTSIKTINIVAKGDWLGEFQNVNLHQDESGDIYMFGMGKSQMGGVDTCRIFELFIRENDASIYATWINDSGEIVKDLCILPYLKERKNELTFTCTNGTSFHWASCIHMEDRNLIEEKFRRDKDLKKQNINEGFRGIFTIYTINKGVKKTEAKNPKDLKNNLIDYQIQSNAFTEPEFEKENSTT